MLDFTKNIELERSWHKKYVWIKSLSYAAFLAVMVFVSYKILFQTQTLTFDFANAKSSQNEITNTRDENGEAENGDLENEEELVFDAILLGDYSRISAAVALGEEEKSDFQGAVLLRKSYQSLFYPQGAPMGFRDGFLIKNGNDYFIVSDGKLRKFASVSLAESMGFPKESFLEADDEDLGYNPAGEEVANADTYPEGALFFVDGEGYYKMKNGALQEFVSENAFLSQYTRNQAVGKDQAFLEKHPRAEDFALFRDGALLAAGDSVYIASGNKIYPVNNPETFESMGYQWSDLIYASSEEIAVYERDEKLFNLKSPHPTGTIFADDETGKYLYIDNGKKRPLQGTAILKTYLKSDPVIYSEKGLEFKNACTLKESPSLSEDYVCRIPIDYLKSFRGNDYQFSIDFSSETKVKELSMTFSQTLTVANFKNSLLDLKKRVLKTYSR
ncbi:MAG: hypothetical protein UY41_C0040G0003 [Candidatus Moranbacteria bacterium GW2011_GWE1_49_15]|nr:MAG: hypothetical protein UX75_C0026G0010 [Candidatus Moranbacteria bacterium GW2011_GWE2_47_10]KKW05819.1 MAG: hypothetical protein UY41_C0040G0003 [Candidatus Moranbacteria bacterium GW2011_GWE1_49_15]HBP00874.1 hypothetical protein [Candidatus Moranbacteria bacterium]